MNKMSDGCYHYFLTNIVKNKGLSKNTLYFDTTATGSLFYSTGRAIHIVTPVRSKELNVYVLNDYILKEDNSAKLKGIYKIFKTKELLVDYVKENAIVIK